MYWPQSPGQAGFSDTRLEATAPCRPIPLAGAGARGAERVPLDSAPSALGGGLGRRPRDWTGAGLAAAERGRGVRSRRRGVLAFRLRLPEGLPSAVAAPRRHLSTLLCPWSCGPGRAPRTASAAVEKRCPARPALAAVSRRASVRGRGRRATQRRRRAAKGGDGSRTTAPCRRRRCAGPLGCADNAAGLGLCAPPASGWHLDGVPARPLRPGAALPAGLVPTGPEAPPPGPRGREEQSVRPAAVRGNLLAG